MSTFMPKLNMILESLPLYSALDYSKVDEVNARCQVFDILFLLDRQLLHLPGLSPNQGISFLIKENEEKEGFSYKSRRIREFTFLAI